MKVHLCQALCPERHCILAVAISEEEGPEEIAALAGKVRILVEALTAAETIHPWCDVCGSRAVFYETNRMAGEFASLQEANVLIKQFEQEQQRSRELIRQWGGWEKIQKTRRTAHFN